MGDWFRNRIVKNRVFILGAGFSAEAGVPLTKNLLPLAMEKFQRECPGIFVRVNNYAKTCFSIDDTDLDYSKISFSDLCTFLEYIELREYAGGERWSDRGSREKLALRYYLSKIIVEKTPLANQVPELYLEFAKQLHEGDIVISFNWDCLLEVALGKLQKSYSYNFERGKIRLCKLHGSINWRIGRYRYSPSLKWISMGFNPQEIYYTTDLLSFDVWNKFEPLQEVEPFLILPGYGKAFDVRSIATLWYKPEFAFDWTYDIYIIGIGLSSDDFFVRSFFLDNLPYVGECTDISDREIIIINPDQNAKNNYNFVLERGLAKLINEEFSIKHIQLIHDKLNKV